MSHFDPRVYSGEARSSSPSQGNTCGCVGAYSSRRGIVHQGLITPAAQDKDKVIVLVLLQLPVHYVPYIPDILGGLRLLPTPGSPLLPYAPGSVRILVDHLP